jgi:hypothetical protein
MNNFARWKFNTIRILIDLFKVLFARKPETLAPAAPEYNWRLPDTKKTDAETVLDISLPKEQPEARLQPKELPRETELERKQEEAEQEAKERLACKMERIRKQKERDLVVEYLLLGADQRRRQSLKRFEEEEIRKIFVQESSRKGLRGHSYYDPKEWFYRDDYDGDLEVPIQEKKFRQIRRKKKFRQVGRK